MSSLTGPPADVPTLTEIVHPVPVSEAPSSGGIAQGKMSSEMAELMVQRVLQRIELVLDRRLHEAIEQLILEHTDALLPRLREEVELVVRESVSQAFEQESPAFPGQSENLKQEVS
ncbi:hypothetical protein [Polaromonas sp.]|jgi:hypothetical protein|uniref:hypothetical protein n=1 Tax=Polaromonas sp. TaxID=1869339 RepID=UPI001A34E9C6|nr:hypothetical protein [Burkholderiales bacterium]MBH2018125.1 hypothetical protein [Burkholderiales bacterium]